MDNWCHILGYPTYTRIRGGIDMGILIKLYYKDEDYISYSLLFLPESNSHNLLLKKNDNWILSPILYPPRKDQVGNLYNLCMCQPFIKCI